MNTNVHFLFYSLPDPVDNIIILDEAETHHAVKVLRVQQSDPICITNGNGTIFTCTCTGFQDKKLIAKIIETYITQRNSSIHLLVGLPERDSFELLITECTALGISHITPVIAAHCQRSWWKPSWEKHLDRFKTKMIVSMKQSLYPFLPILHDPITLEKSTQVVRGTLLLAQSDGVYLNAIKNSIDLQNVACYVGPPGGFSTSEVDFILSIGGKKVKIGESRLRTELASVALCAQICALQH